MNHSAGIQDAIAKQMVELETSAVEFPVMFTVRVEEAVSLRGQHRQMLDIPPGQLRTGQSQDGIGYTQLNIVGPYCKDCF